MVKTYIDFWCFQSFLFAPARIVGVRDVQHEAVLRPWEQGLFGQPPQDRRGFTRTQKQFQWNNMEQLYITNY